MSTKTRTVAEIVWDIVGEPCINRREPDRVPAMVNHDCEELGCMQYTARGLMESGRWSGGPRPRMEYSLSDFGEPTVDDMLAWLVAKRRQYEFHVASNGVWGYSGPDGWNIEEPIGSDQGVAVERFPTLAACVSAAVLAVAEREEPGDGAS